MQDWLLKNAQPLMLTSSGSLTKRNTQWLVGWLGFNGTFGTEKATSCL